MPNWCSTSINFYSEDPNLIKDYQERLQEVYDASATVENDFGGGWLGDFVNALLAPDYHTEIGNIRCRGSIIEPPNTFDIVFEETHGVYYFSICTETAWAPMLEMWVRILEKYYGEKIRIAFSAEECGMCIYENYDPEGIFLFSRYKVDGYLEGDYDADYFDTLEEVIDYLCSTECLGITPGQLENKTVSEISEFIGELTLPSEDDYLAVYEYTEFDGSLLDLN